MKQRSNQSPNRPEESTPWFSFVLPVLNESLYLEATLQSLVEQTVTSDSYEVLIYDGGSSDNTREIANRWTSRFAYCRVSSNPKKLPSIARNLGLAEARGRVIAFVEGHCIVPSCFVERATQLLQEKDVAALGRPINLVVPKAPSIQKGIGIARQSPLGHARTSLLYSRYEGYCSPVSCATIYSREVFDKLGRFDEGLYVGEDVEFNQRLQQAGFRHYFSQELSCYYYPRRTFAEFFRQMYNYGIGRTRSSTRRGEMRLSDLAPIIAVGGVFLSLTATIVFSWLFLLPVVAYLILVAAYSLMISYFNHKTLLCVYVFVAMLIVHFGLAAGQSSGIIEWICERRH